MNKKLLAMAVGVAVLAPGMALADVSIYGRAHVSLDQLDDGGDYNETNLSSNSSRLGFRGDTKIADSNLTAFFQVETEINFAQGKGSSWASRDTFVGLKGDFGMVRAGQFDSPFKAARDPANLFGDQLGDMRNLTRVGDARFDERMPNTIHYQTPSYNGLQFNLGYSIHEGTYKGDAGTGENSKSDGVSASVTYANGPFQGALAYEQYGNDTGNGKRKAVRLAGAYKVADPVKLVAFYQNANHDNDAFDSDTWGLGAEFQVAPATYVKGMYMTMDADAKDKSADMVAVGVEHRLDKALRVYANYAIVMNDDLAALTPWQQARTTNVGGAAGENAQGLSLGMRYDF